MGDPQPPASGLARIRARFAGPPVAKVDLPEAVAIKALDAGRLDVTHVREPQLTPPYDDPFWKLYNGDNLLAEWATPKSI